MFVRSPSLLLLFPLSSHKRFPVLSSPLCSVCFLLWTLSHFSHLLKGLSLLVGSPIKYFLGVRIHIWLTCLLLLIRHSAYLIHTYIRTYSHGYFIFPLPCLPSSHRFDPILLFICFLSLSLDSESELTWVIYGFIYVGYYGGQELWDE